MSALKLCVIGNSHLGAMKLGWDKLAEFADPVLEGVKPTYFGAPRDKLRKLEVRNGTLVPTTPAVRDQFMALAGIDHLNPANYDVFLLVGLGANFKRVLRLYHSCRWSGVAAKPNLPLVSPNFAQSYLIDGYQRTRLVDVAEKLAVITDKPIYAIPEPLWSPRTSPCPAGRDFGWLETAESSDAAQLAQLFRRALTAAAAPRIRLLPQPDVTIDEDILTRGEFNRGADKDISGKGGGKDAAHMNADYGAALWQSYLDTIRASQPSLILAE